LVAQPSVIERACGPAVAGQECQVIVHCVGDGVAAGLPRSASTTRCILSLREIQYVLAVGVGEVVRDDQLAIRRAQVDDGVGALAAIAPRNPRAGPAGELSIADVQPRLDQPVVRLAAHLKPAAGGTCFEGGIANLPRHGLVSSPKPVQYM